MAVLVLDKIVIWANSRSVYVHLFRSTEEGEVFFDGRVNGKL